MYLGVYEIDGEPEQLLAAYDRLMAGMPPGQIEFHACAVRDGGITIFDACPTKEAFERFSTSVEFRGAAEAAGLQWPTRIEGLPLHAVRARRFDDRLTDPRRVGCTAVLETRRRPPPRVVRRPSR